MPEEQQHAADGGESGSSFTPIESQEQFNKILGPRLAAERAKFADYDDLKAKAARLDEAEAANKTEAQKLSDRLTATETEKATLANENARLKAAVKYGLSEEDANALEGIPADKVGPLAERLAAAAQQAAPKQQKKAAPPGKASGETDAPSRAAEALRTLRKG